MHVKVALRCFILVSEYSSTSLWYAPYMYIHVLLCVFTVHFFCECAWVYVATWVWQAIQLNLVIYNIAINACEKVSEWQQSLVWFQAAKAETCSRLNHWEIWGWSHSIAPNESGALKGTEQTDEVFMLVNSTWLCHLQKMQLSKCKVMYWDNMGQHPGVQANCLDMQRFPHVCVCLTQKFMLVGSYQL